MEVEEIYSLAISPLVVSRFAIQWSPDNHISVLTERGIHIFELIPSPMSPHSTIRFSRSFIYVPSIFPTEVIASKMESKIWSMHREAVYSFMLEESSTPKMSNVKEMVPKIIDIAWSPQNLIHPSKCLLAILTSSGAIVVAHKMSKEWYPAYDLCSIRYDAVEEKINAKLKNSKNNPSILTLKNCIKTLQASCMTWSMLFTNFAYLAVAYQNGDIIIYKLPRILNCNEILQPTIMSTIELNDCIKITTLHWITVSTKEHVIIIGYFDGRIYGLKIEEENQIFEVKSNDKYYDYADRITVSAIQTFPQNGSNIKVLISKGTFLFLVHFTIKGEFKSIQHLQLEGFVLSGLICIGSDYALVTTEDSSMFVIDTRESYFFKTKIKSGLPQGQLRYLGLAHSLSYAIFVTITSPNIVYDHLVVKEPSKMYMFTLKNENWDPLITLQKSKDGKKFGELWDCLEVVRIRATKTADPATVLPKIPFNLEFLSLHELRIAMWISVILEISEKKKVIQGIGSIAGEISEAQPLIFIHTACNYLEQLLNKSSLLNEEKLSMNLLRMYLEVYLAGEENEEASPLSKRVKDILKKISPFCSNMIESCNLCNEAINELPWKVTKCPQNHILPRCAITLLQITVMEYGTCPVCGLMFHWCLNQVFKETKCLFCDVPAPLENRVLSFKSCVSTEQSLSRQRNYGTVSEDQEMETPVDES
ncbi:uncharacterized protein LOC143183068 [Calliopsis andreniformis]|uniref:uncharacterized protein LOC143183068 n=1 Tax=Calliopsis andreniformis TaxID=337506 RepID=UPI003FCDBCC9